MTSCIKALALSLGLTWALAFAFTPVACGGSGRGADLAAPGQADADVPEGVALQIRTCAAEYRAHLGSVEHYFIFDVKLASDGEVDSVALRESTLSDQGLELCIVKALRSLTEDALTMRRSENGGRSPVSPESRTLLGQEQALGCLAMPPCLLALGFLVGAAYVTVQIYLQASSHPGTRTHHPPAVATEEPPATTAPTATTVPTATTMPTAMPITTAVPVARRYPGQTCENDVLDGLEKEKDKLCGGYSVSSCNPKKVDTSKIRCSAILRAIPQRQACLAARQLIQDRCFGGKPDAGHKTQIDDVENGIRQCEALKLINCAKGHSMAGL
jgi:hypothetical protein